MELTPAVIQKQLAAAFQAFGYKPHAEQWRIHKGLCSVRLGLVAGGWRGGKSRFGAADHLARAWAYSDAAPGGLFLEWLVGNTYDDTHPEFDYMLNDLTTLGFIVPNSVSRPKMRSWSLQAKFPRGGVLEVETRTASDEEALSSRAPHQILMCEAGKCSYSAFTYALGRLMEKRGNLLAVGTVKKGDQGWYSEYYDLWKEENPDGGQSFSLPSWANLTVFPHGRLDPAIRQMETFYRHDPALFDELIAGVPSRRRGLAYPAFNYRDHVKAQLFQKHYPESSRPIPVYLAIDYGYSNPYAVLAIQVVDGVINVVDEIYITSMVDKDVINLAKEREWWANVPGANPSIQGIHIGTCDQSAPATVHNWLLEGGVPLATKQIGQDAGRDRLRDFISPPGRFFVDERCTYTIDEFKSHRYREPRHPELTGRKERVIDKDNHALTALQYFVFINFGPADLPAPLAEKASQFQQRIYQPRSFAGLRSQLGL